MTIRFFDPDAIDPPRVFRGKRQEIFAFIWNNPGASNRDVAVAVYADRPHSRKDVSVQVINIDKLLRQFTPWQLLVRPMRCITRGRRPKTYKIIKRTTANARPDLTPRLS